MWGIQIKVRMTCLEQLLKKKNSTDTKTTGWESGEEALMPVWTSARETFARVALKWSGYGQGEYNKDLLYTAEICETDIDTHHSEFPNCSYNPMRRLQARFCRASLGSRWGNWESREISKGLAVFCNSRLAVLRDHVSLTYIFRTSALFQRLRSIVNRHTDSSHISTTAAPDPWGCNKPSHRPIVGCAFIDPVSYSALEGTAIPFAAACLLSEMYSVVYFRFGAELGLMFRASHTTSPYVFRLVSSSSSRRDSLCHGCSGSWAPGSSLPATAKSTSSAAPAAKSQPTCSWQHLSRFVPMASLAQCPMLWHSDPALFSDHVAEVCWPTRKHPPDVNVVFFVQPAAPALESPPIATMLSLRYAVGTPTRHVACEVSIVRYVCKRVKLVRVAFPPARHCSPCRWVSAMSGRSATRYTSLADTLW